MTRLRRALRPLVDTEPLEAARKCLSSAPCHLVGGALRDALLDSEPDDLDLVVAGGGRAFSSALAERLGARLVDLGGERFASYRIVGARLTVDVWDRGGTSLTADLERRDFTVNAIALDIVDASVEDPFDGLGDIERRRLRAVTDSTFSADPLRVLRLIRLALALPGFSIENGTRRLAARSTPAIAQVARERQRSELDRILTHGPPSEAIELMASLSVLSLFWPDSAHRSFDSSLLHTWLRRYERLEVLCGRALGQRPDRLLATHALTARAAALVGSRPPSALVADLGRRGLLTRTGARRIARLADAETDLEERTPRQFLASWQNDWLEAAAVLAARVESAEDPSIDDKLLDLARIVESEGRDALAPRPLLDGREICDHLDLREGPVVGRILALLLEAQLDGRIGTREEALGALSSLLDLARGAGSDAGIDDESPPETDPRRRCS